MFHTHGRHYGLYVGSLESDENRTWWSRIEKESNDPATYPFVGLDTISFVNSRTMFDGWHCLDPELIIPSEFLGGYIVAGGLVDIEG